MTLVDRLFPRNGSAPAPAAAPAGPLTEAAPPASELAVRRDRLARELAERQLDLGGLTYEMAIRDHFRLDVLVKASAAMQEVDAELGEVERLLALEQQSSSGACGGCGALHGRGATFCWQCGRQLLEQASPAT